MTDRAAPAGLPPLSAYWPQIEIALRHGAESFTLDEITAAVQDGTIQFWPLPHSVLLTQVSGETLHFFVAAGQMDEVQAAVPHILEFGREQGCNRATLTGRKGWARSWLKDDGWSVAPLIHMERKL